MFAIGSLFGTVCSCLGPNLAFIIKLVCHIGADNYGQLHPKPRMCSPLTSSSIVNIPAQHICLPVVLTTCFSFHAQFQDARAGFETSQVSQHRHSLHPTLPVSGPSPQDHPQPSHSPSLPRDLSLPPPDFSPPPRPSSPILPDPTHEDSNTDTEFTDTSKHCYRTFHLKLNGKFRSSLNTPFLTQIYA
jgi:hypothetical protein